MKNNYFKARQIESVLESKLSLWRNVLMLGFLMLFAHLSTYAQPCPSKLAMTITTVDSDSATTNRAKIRVTGIAYTNYKVGINPGPSYTGSFASASLVSSLINGEVATGLAAPTAIPGTEYTVRVYKGDNSCYTDSTFYLPYVNYNYTPEFVDIQSIITKTPGGASPDAPLGSNVSITVIVTNQGNKDATGVEFTIAYAAGLTPVGTPIASVGTYDPITKIWTIGNIAKNPGTPVPLTLILDFTVTTRGIKEITAHNTKLNEIDIDSSPTNNLILEDDEGQTCITSHLDYCDGDEFTFTLASGIYKGIVWQKSNDNGATWADLPPFSSTADYTIGTDSILVIKRPGDYKYKKDAIGAACGYDGCCPIKVIPGLPPILTKPLDVIVCFGATDTTIAATNIQTGYTLTSNVTYGIIATLPAFMPDNQGFKYQWYNNNGVSNPTTTILADTTLKLSNATLPNVVGKYSYRLISYQKGHESCNDTTDVNFQVNELPVPLATVNSPVCQEDTIFLKARNTALNPTPGINWFWSGPNGFTHNDSTQRILNAQPVNEGKYVVRASYSLDGLSCSNTDTVDVKVNLLPAPPLAIDTVYCQAIAAKKLSTILRLPAVATSSDSLRWYEGPANYQFTDYPDATTSIGYNVGPIPQTAASGQDKWFVTHVDVNGCQSHPDTLIINIDPKPVKPTVRDIAYCENYPTVPLTAVTSPGSFGLIWYGLNKSVRDTVATFPIPSPAAPIGTFSYYVSQYSISTNSGGVIRGGCQSDTAKLDVIIKDTPLAPAVVEPIYCLLDAPAPLIATPVITNVGTGVGSNIPNVLSWYWAGDTTGVTPIPSTAIAGSTWYYVSQTTTYDTLKCESPQAPLKVTVNPLPVASIIPVSALCVGTQSQNNGQLILTRYRNSDVVSWNIGSAYGSPAIPTAFVAPGTGGVFASGLSNPTGSQEPYSAQIRNTFGCIITLTTQLVAKDCTCPGGYCEPASIAKTK